MKETWFNICTEKHDAKNNMRKTVPWITGKRNWNSRTRFSLRNNRNAYSKGTINIDIIGRQKGFFSEHFLFDHRFRFSILRHRLFLSIASTPFDFTIETFYASEIKKCVNFSRHALTSWEPTGNKRIESCWSQKDRNMYIFLTKGKGTCRLNNFFWKWRNVSKNRNSRKCWWK